MSPLARATITVIVALGLIAHPPALEADLPSAMPDPRSGELDSLRVTEAGIGTAGPQGATVTLTKTPDGYQVDGVCPVRATRATAWSVLTDYEGIDNFAPSMRVSRVLSRAPDHWLVEQIASARVFVFGRKMRVVLEIHEQPPDSIRFADIAKEDFIGYHGLWRIESQGTDTRVIYRVTATPRFSVPDFVMRNALRTNLRALLPAVGREIERRAASAGG